MSARSDDDARNDDICRECGGWGETLMYWLENAFALADKRFEIVENHPCPYCKRDDDA